MRSWDWLQTSSHCGAHRKATHQESCSCTLSLRRVRAGASHCSSLYVEQQQPSDLYCGSQQYQPRCRQRLQKSMLCGVKRPAHATRKPSRFWTSSEVQGLRGEIHTPALTVRAGHLLHVFRIQMDTSVFPPAHLLCHMQSPWPATVPEEKQTAFEGPSGGLICRNKICMLPQSLQCPYTGPALKEASLRTLLVRSVWHRMSAGSSASCSS